MYYDVVVVVPVAWVGITTKKKWKESPRIRRENK